MVDDRRRVGIARWAPFVMSMLIALSQVSARAEVATKMNPTLIGANVCDVRATRGMSGAFEAFDKDPSAFMFGFVSVDEKKRVIVIDKIEDEVCGTIIAEMTIEKQETSEANERIGFNCAVLNQVFHRYKSYLGMFLPNDFEFTVARRAWSFDFETKKFEPYSQTQNVYCSNFIAD